MEDPGLVARFSGPDFTKNFGCRGNTVERGGLESRPSKVVKWSWGFKAPFPRLRAHHFGMP